MVGFNIKMFEYSMSLPNDYVLSEGTYFNCKT